MILLNMCIKIFLVRILDVSLGTIRTIITVKGKTLLAAIIGFIEVFIWFVVVKEAINVNNNSIFIAISYASGFATGTYIGGILSKILIKSNLTIQIISSKFKDIAKVLRNSNYGISIVDIDGIDNKIDRKMIITETSSINLVEIRTIIRNIDNKAFVFINETKYVFNGYEGIKKED